MYELVHLGGRGQCMSWCHWGEGSVYKLVPLGGGVSV